MHAAVFTILPARLKAATPSCVPGCKEPQPPVWLWLHQRGVGPETLQRTRRSPVVRTQGRTPGAEQWFRRSALVSAYCCGLQPSEPDLGGPP